LDCASILAPHLALETGARSAGDSALPPRFSFVREISVCKSIAASCIGVTEHLAHSRVHEKEFPVFISHESAVRGPQRFLGPSGLSLLAPSANGQPTCNQEDSNEKAHQSGQ
jgi:hypothetical protein